MVVRQEMDDTRDADQGINEIDAELQELSEQLEMKEAISEDVSKKRKDLLAGIIKEMNKFYKFVDMANVAEYDNIFTPKDKIYSGSEATEFHLARMYAFVKMLWHDYPTIVDSFKAEDLSSDREKRALQMFEKVSNQIIFTTTLKMRKIINTQTAKVYIILILAHMLQTKCYLRNICHDFWRPQRIC